MQKNFILITLSIVLLSSCSIARFVGYYASAGSDDGGSLDGLVYTTDETSYKIGVLPSDWKRIGIKGGDLAFSNAVKDATITVNSTCDPKKKNYSLKALSESLIIGIKDKEAQKREETTVDGQKALQSLYTGTLNGVPVNIETVVFRKGDCIYDFTYASPQDSFESDIAVFDEFISEFRVL